MRSRPLIWILLCLLLAAGVWLFWPEIHPAQKIAARKKNLQHGFVAVQSISPKVLPASMAATNALALTKTNEFAYRLTNTKKTIGELENDPHAILLENAFIDTSEPLNLNIPKNLQAQGDPGEYIVQANGVINNAFRAMLAAAGGRIISYIPNDAFLAQLSPASAKVVANNPMTAAVIPYEPYYKMPPSFLTALSQNPDQPLAVSEMQVAAFPGAADEARAALENLGAKIIGQESSPFGDVFTIQNVSDVTALARLRVVQLIEPFHTRVVANDLARVTLGISTNTTTAANYMGLTGKNVIVEVNDTGIDANHPDLTTARIFGDTVESLVDTNGHGTHVAGIIASSGINSKKPPGPTDVGANARGSVSGADFRGKAPAADLYSIVALGGTNFVSDRYLQESAAKTNALISNNSWILGGDNAYDLTAASYDAAVRDALPGVTGSQPVLFVFAAGDDGNGNDDGGGGDPDTVLSPATAKNVITVGALEQLRNITNIVTDANSNSSAVWQPMTDSADQVAGYSSRGNVGVGTEGTFGRFKPDVVAPGSFVVSTRSGQWDTNAYYNPTNYSVESASDVVTPDSPNQYSVSVPANAAEVDISITANSNSPSPFPDFPIYVKLNGTPSPTSYDFVKNNNQVKIPPDGGGAIAGIQSIQNGGFNFAIADGANVPASYDVKVEIISTNDYGDYYSVLEALNETLAPYYRYESGTSMSAPAISGVLALMQDYFTNTLAYTPSPALLKAMLINGSRAVSNYRFAVTNSINFQGWGLANLTNSLPLGITNAIGTACSSFFLDQSPVNALATGDSHTFAVTVTNLAATILPLRVTLAWTDPPGDPAAAIKLVNNLDLIVSNSVTGKIYYGNNFLSSGNPPYSIASNPTNAPALDSINNVENVFIPPLLSQGTYYVTVVGRSVNVNAVTAQTNNVVQDFALVISLGNGQMTNAMTVTDGGVISNPTGDQDITYVAATNTPLLNQFVGANTPLLGTNAIPLAGATNGQITLGMTNQWHFYVVTNTTTFTNAAFITFLPDTLAIPRMGVFANSDANATRPEADIDLYVTRSSVIPNAGALTNLDPTVIAAADKSLTRSGTEFVAYTNAQPNEVFYIGVKSEDHEGAEYDLIPIFTQTPFSQIGPNGDEYVNALNVPIAIPDGTPSHPGTAYVFALALQPITVQRVVVTNLIVHQNFGDLIGTLSHNGKNDVLNNHNGLGNWPGTPIIYDDSGRGDIPNSQPSDGPGSLQTFQGDDGSGVWRLTEIDDALTQTGTVTGLTFFVEKHQNPKKGINVVIQPSTWFYTYIDVPAGITNLQIFATNLTGTAMSPLQLYLRYGSQPDQNNYDFEAGLTNGVPPGNMISDGPPLITPGRYFIGIFNPSFSSATVFLLAVLNGPTLVVQPTDFKTNGVPLLDDAVTNSSIFISATNPIASIDVGMVVQHPRISDLTFTLVSPSGQRILLMENRGGLTATNAGHLNITTNFFGNQVSGGPLGNTNVISFPYNVGTLVIDYNFETIPDSMDVYYDGVDIFSTFTNNPGNPPVDQTFYIPFGPGVSTNITIVMNQNGNADTNTAWTYTPYVISEDYNYLTFTEDTNLTDIPIKFAIPPFDLTDRGTNYALSDFELATNGDYFAPTNIFDPFGGWYLPTNRITLSTVISNVGGNDQIFTVTNVTILTNNEVSVVNDPANAFVGSNFLALANGFILRTNFMTPQRKYTLTYLYRGPGISGWWRGEGNALDSADPERLGQNGSLIGRFDFPAGEVGQAFQMENNGSAYDFAGTNSYVQIRQAPVLKTINSNGTPVIVQSSALDVGTGSGFTIEGWINPTNVSFQQPLVEWLARVPTNGSDTNLTIEAGPFLDRATGHYYYLLNATNWTTSELWATQLAGHLATIDTANEENWVYDTFANFGGTNRALWIGLNDATNPGTFVYSSGLTDVTYTNWANGQPDECTGAEHYVAIINPTNALSGLWMVADNNGIACTAPKTNTIYGVVEVDDIQTNGVQFWISVTNQPGTTNSLVSSNGCLYANLVDTTNGDHIIFSAPDLVQSNLYQHVALTYDTNSGIANLYYDGTNVATTNFGVAFIPKTTGDVLLGKDMSRETNNFYGGKMDEMSIYSRTLSDSEIAAIYRISAFTTNRLIGKFNPSVTPPESLAEAQVSLGDQTNILFGENNNWQIGGFTFTAQTNSLPMQITGIEPGMLFDSFAVTEVPLGNLYYLPEQSLDELTGESAYGTWTLEIWDNRTGAVATNAQLVSWQMQIVLQTNAPPPVNVSPQTPTTITVLPGQIVPLFISVPSWAHFATNILDSASGPVDLLFNPTNPPTGGADDTVLINNQSAPPAIIGNPILSATSNPLLPTNSYYLGVRNNGAHAVTATVEVDFDITLLTNSVPFTDVLKTNDAGRYFSFDVSSNAFEATFQLLRLSGNADLVVSKGAPLPTLLSSDYGSFNVGNADENIYVLTNSSPVPLSAGRWFIGVIKRDSGVVHYTVLAKELTNSISSSVTIIDLTNGVPFNFTAGPGAALTNFFRFTVTNTITPTVTNYVQSIHFELYHLTGNGDLTVQTNVPPFAPPFFQSSRQPGTIPEFIQIHTNSALTNLAAAWYLGVPDDETNLINFTILAVIDTNNVFPAFPGAEGAGAGALGGGSLPARGGFTNNTVYHVINLNDSGPGSLRDAVSSTNRTIVFDVSGILFLQSPLVITNSYLTIAGQTAPGGGVTVAGQMTELQSVHDVIVRDVRFHFGGALTSTAVVWANGFENVNGSPTVAGMTGSVAGWTIVSGDIDLLGPDNGAHSIPYEGSYFIDLNGWGPGEISTNIPTIPGVNYALNFAYTRNPDSGVIPEADVSINGTLLTNVVTDYTNTDSNLDWHLMSAPFTATSSSTLLDFTATSPGASGVLLDAVSLTTNVAINASTSDSLQFNTVSNVIADHISALWSTNEDLSVLNSTNVTVQWSIISDSLNDTNLLHGYGSLLRYGGGALSLHHNLYADNYNASPRLGDNINLDFVNNVIYDWGTNAGFSTNDIADNPAGFTNELNYIGNYLIASTNSFLKNIAFWGGSTNTWIYQTNNFIDSNTNGILDGANTGWNMFTNKFTKFDRQFPLPPVSVDEAFLAYEKVLDFAGPDMGQRDWADTNIISKVRSQTGQIISIRPTIGLVAWWKGESNILDSAGTNNGTVTQGTVGYAPAEVGLGFSFNGGANRIAVPNAPALNFGANKDFSIEAWISPLTNNQGSLFSGVMTIVDKRVAPNTSQCLGYELSLASGVLNLRISQSLSGNGVNWIAGPDLRDGKMHHVAVTLVRNLTTGGHMYVDGVQVLQFDPTSQSGDLSNTNSLLIGNHPTSGLFTYFDGRIDELSIYKRALSADEIQSIYQIGRAGKFYTDTRPYLDTDQDGIPDFWEDTFGTDPFSPNPNGVTDGSGYTELEEYINWLAAPHALTITNTPVGVDLQHLFGQTGNLSFFVTNGVNGTVYLTNVLGSVTNTGTFSNTIAIFTPTNNASGGTNFYGYASFDAYVTNNDTIAYFGPVTVSVVVGNVRTITINSNMPPVITVLTNGVLDPTNYSGSDFYQISVETNVIGLLVNVTNIVPSGAADLLLAYGRLPSLSDYDYISTNTANESIFVSPNSTPVSLTNGDWYAAVVNVNRSGDPVSYDIEYQKYLSAYPPLFNYPTNGSSFTNIETTLFNINCLATDTNTPPLPLTYALVSGPIGGGLSINATTGAIDWTPTEAQGPSTNSISVSVSNGAYSVTNSFTIIVEESNLPPVLPSVPNQVVIVPGTLVVTNTATDPDIPTNPLTYMLTSTVLGTNTPGIDTNGIITWTPTLAQAGTNYLFTTIVTDTNQWAVNSKSLSATNYFYVTVATGATNGVPQTNSVPPGGINWLPVRVPTNAIAATNILLYATNLPVNVWFSANVPPTITNANDFILLPNAMSGMSVLTTNSAPTNIVPGGIYFLGVQNTNSVAVTYDLEVNFGFISSTNAATNAIFISSIIYTNGGFLLTWFAPTSDVFQAQETASLTPPISWNTFSNIITYASLTPTNGMFTFFDNGSQFPFGPMRYYRLLLLQATNTLILPRQTNYIANVGMPLTITNTATDSNAGAILNYVLTSFPLPSTPATIAANGIITWTPGAGDSGGAFKFITAVTDNSAPPLSATNAFTVFVLPPPAISNVVATATNVTLRWLAPTNDIFQVEWTTNLTPVVDWIPFPPTITSTDSFFTFTDTNAPLATKFYRLLWLPLP